MKENIESRRISEIRAAAENRTISGTAIVFDKESSVMGRWDPFTEIIKREAVTPDLITKSNIVMLWNHEDDMVPLARSKNGKGSLSITITETGVDFSFEAKQTPFGDEILAAVRAGDVDSCSFAFTVEEDGSTWFSKPDGGYLRTITKFDELFDLSLVNNPAYAEATCRSMDKFKAETRTEPPAPPADPPAPPADPPAPPADPPAPPTPPADPPAPEPLSPELEAYYAPIEATIAELSK